jgi:hypothetical protein
MRGGEGPVNPPLSNYNNKRSKAMKLRREINAFKTLDKKTFTQRANNNVNRAIRDRNQYFLKIKNQLGERMRASREQTGKNFGKYVNKGTELNTFIKNEGITVKVLENGSKSMFNMHEKVLKKIEDLEKVLGASKIIKKDIDHDKELLKQIAEAEETLSIAENMSDAEREDKETALLVAMKLFYYIEIFRAQSCPQYENNMFTVEFLNDGMIEGVDISYRRRGLRLLQRAYDRMIQEKSEKTDAEIQELPAWKKSLKALGKTAGDSLSKFTGTSKRASRKEMKDLLISLERNSIVKKSICDWQRFANRLAEDFKFPDVSLMHPNLSQAQLDEQIGKAVLVGSARTFFILGTVAIGLVFPQSFGLTYNLLKNYVSGPSTSFKKNESNYTSSTLSMPPRTTSPQPSLKTNSYSVPPSSSARTNSMSKGANAYQASQALSAAPNAIRGASEGASFLSGLF